MPAPAVIRYRELSGYKYQLAERAEFDTGIRLDGPVRIPDYIDMDAWGVLTTHAGYCWDGPSGPAVDTRSALRASLAHDAGYQLMRARRLGEKFRGPFDDLFRRVLREDGVSAFRAWYMWAGVRVGAGWAARPGGADDGQGVIRTAP